MSAGAVALVAAGLAGLLAAPAQAFDVPQCNADQTYARPGLDRSFNMYCSFTDEAELVEAPAHGELTALAIDRGGTLTYRYKADDEAPGADAFVLELSGPAGSLEHRVGIEIIPRSVNSAPVCEPVRHAERTDGAGPVEIEFNVWCRDDESDEITIDGGGPGTHLSTPIAVSGGMGGGGVPRMHYRTATADGAEQATYWATDVLGARSEEAPIDIEIGPGIDRLAECRPTPAFYGGDAFPVLARPGAVRRFAVICEDADGDAIEPRVVDPPSRGVIATFLASPPQYGYWGVQRWVDSTYVPTVVGSGAGEGEDRFSVRADGPRGAGQEATLAIQTRALPANAGGACGYNGGRTLPGVPTALLFTCSDDEGDPLSATVSEGPLHGIAGPAVIVPALYGNELISVPYTPSPTFVGVDVVEVTIADGNGLEFVIPVGVSVDPGNVEWPDPDLPDPDLPDPDPDLPDPDLPDPDLPDPDLPDPDLPDPDLPDPAEVSAPRDPPARPPAASGTGPNRAPPPPLAPAVRRPAPAFLDAPDAGQPPAVAPRDQARQVLGTADVRLLKTIGSARLYARSGDGPAPSHLAVTCSVRCAVGVGRRLERVGAPSRSARLRERKVVAEPSRAKRIALRLSRAERRRAGRSGRRVLALRVTVEDAAGASRSARLRVRVR